MWSAKLKKGKPMKYSKEKIEECAKWVAENGLMDYGGAMLQHFCKAMDINEDTYYEWQKKTEFSEAIKNAKAHFKSNLSNNIVKSLAKVATGYTYEKSKTEYVDKDGKPRVKKKTVEEVEVQPNVGAAIFLLTNMDGETWKNKQSNEVDGKIDTDVKISYIQARNKFAGKEDEVDE